MSATAKQNIRFGDRGFSREFYSGLLFLFVIFVTYTALGARVAAVVSVVSCLYLYRGIFRSLALVLLFGVWQSIDPSPFSLLGFYQSILDQNLITGIDRIAFMAIIFMSLLKNMVSFPSDISKKLLMIAGLTAVSFLALYLEGNLSQTSGGRLVSALVLLLTASVLSGVRDAESQSLNRAVGFLLGLLTGMVVLGLLLYGLGYGNRVNGSFQGVAAHPQSWGLIGGSLVVVIFSLRLWKPVFLAIAGAALLTVVLSDTRTAIFACVLVMLYCLVVRVERPQFREFAGRAMLFLCVGIALLVLASGLAPDLLGKGTFVGDYFEARGGIFAESSRNFWENTFFGIGFGVPSELFLLDVQARMDNIAGMGQTGEKGSSYIALFEETGLIGGALWLAVLTTVLRTTLLRSVSAAVILYLLIVSNAEAVLLALSGPAAILWGSALALAFRPGGDSGTRWAVSSTEANARLAVSGARPAAAVHQRQTELTEGLSTLRKRGDA